MLPTTAAITLVLTATGASVAESNTVAPLTLTGVQAMDLKSQEAEAQVDSEQVAQRRAEGQAQAAAIAARQQEADRAARAKKRVALARKVAAAKAKAAADAAAHRWVMPLKSWNFTSGFKMRWGAMHEGNDLAIASGTPIMAMSSGEVVYTGWMGGGGNTTKIRYWDGTVSYFEHQSYIKTHVGAKVSPGEVVGLVGNTGHSFGSHLHLEIHPDGQDAAIDPTPWLHKHNLFLKD